MGKLLRTILLTLIAVLGICVVLGTMFIAYPSFYSDRIYPGVIVRDVDLGGLTVDEAASELVSRLSTLSTGSVELQGPERSWELEWADAGRAYDWAETAQAAYQVARHGPWYRQALAAWQVRREGQSIEPRIDPADRSRVQARLEKVARQIHVLPEDAALRIGADDIVCTSGSAGRSLDVEATLERVMASETTGADEVEAVTNVLPPELEEPEPGCSEAQSLLSRPFTLVADDPLTHYRADFDASPERMVSWVQPVIAGNEIVLDTQAEAVKAWLLEVARQLGTERVLAVDETLRRTVTAVENGEHTVRSTIRHPQSTYVVEAGDTLFDIAYNHGFPQWRLEAANPELEPDQLLIGMELTIPSIDVLFPEPLVPGKRIEISLPEQRLRAYEDDAMVYEFTVSSGMTKTPTIAGQFQVLFKEPEAYAQRWSLDMPYFMGIYYERPGFANGIHELPIRADGTRLWSSILGWPASYGCIILDLGDAEKLYNWAPVGTLVRIEGVAPGTPIYVPTYDEQSTGE